MSDYWVCSDNIDGKENSRIEALCKALKKAGHTAHNGGVGPNTIQSHGQTSASKGQIGVFICGGVDIQVFWDFVQGIGRYYHYKRFIYVYASDTATSDKWLTCHGAKNTPTVRAHDDNYSGGRGDAIGKTVDAYCNEHKDKIWYACGPKGCKFEDVIENFLKGEGAGDGSSSTENKDTNSGSTCKEAVQKLLKHWDGEVECRIIGNRVYINKVREPQSNHSLVLQEGLNVFSDSVKITDVNPDTVNHLVVKWSEGRITIKDEELIKRFGTIKKEVEAVKKIIKTKTKTKTTSSTEDTDTTTEDTSTTDEATDTSSGTGETETSVVDVPITKYKDALEFANTEWHKIKRDNGHTLECQVAGAPNWRVGEWAKVVLPSFGENGYMYITRASHSDDGGDWTCNLTLQDYPPGWGVEEAENNSNSDNNSAKKNNVDDTIKKICDEISKFSYSGSCSDGNCIKSSKKGDCWALSDYIYNRLKSAGISAKIYQYATSGSNQHRQVEYKDGSKWVMFPYSKSGIDHNFYTNSIPSGASVCKGG